MGINISIDPGTAATGWCVWEDGVPRVGTIRTPNDSAYADRLLTLKNALRDLFASFDDLSISEIPITTIAIEQFEPAYHVKQRDGYGQNTALNSMMKCACVQGMVFCLADDWAEQAIMVSKGKVKKAETEIRARAAGLIVDGKRRPSEHALDAFEIGVAAGFDKRNSLSIEV